MLSKIISKEGAFPLLLIITTLLKFTLCRITIDNPDELSKAFNYEKIRANFANFGKVFYGNNFIGKLVFDFNDLEANYFCDVSQKTDFGGLPTFPNYYPIVMVDRGNCNFVTKARNVQKIGGSFALIVNNDEDEDDIDQLIMADDGTGSDIYIPTAIISKKHGEIFKKFMKDNQNNKVLSDVILNIEFKLPQREKVDLKLFLSSATLEIYPLIKSLKHFQKNLLNSTNFEPHYITHTSPNYDPKDPIPLQNCVSRGLYCEFPSFRLSISDGKEIVFENLRQKCIYLLSKGKLKSQLFIDQPANDMLYWNYLEAFHDRCLNNTSKIRFNSECSAESQRSVGLNEFVVHECFLNSFALESYKDENKNFDKEAVQKNYDFENKNFLLAQEEKVRKSWEIKAFPSILVNNKTLQGSLSAENLLGAVCAGLSRRPVVCAKIGFGKAENYIKEGSESIPILYYFVAAIVVCLVYAFVYLVCKKYIAKKVYERIDKGDIDGKISNIVANYFALTESQAA